MSEDTAYLNERGGGGGGRGRGVTRVSPVGKGTTSSYRGISRRLSVDNAVHSSYYVSRTDTLVSSLVFGISQVTHMHAYTHVYSCSFKLCVSGQVTLSGHISWNIPPSEPIAREISIIALTVITNTTRMLLLSILYCVP